MPSEICLAADLPHSRQEGSGRSANKKGYLVSHDHLPKPSARGLACSRMHFVSKFVSSRHSDLCDPCIVHRELRALVEAFKGNQSGTTCVIVKLRKPQERDVKSAVNKANKRQKLESGGSLDSL